MSLDIGLKPGQGKRATAVGGRILYRVLGFHRSVQIPPKTSQGRSKEGQDAIGLHFLAFEGWK